MVKKSNRKRISKRQQDIDDKEKISKMSYERHKEPDITESKAIDSADVKKLKANFDKKSTEELKAIYESNDRDEWRVEAFIAIKQILSESDVKV